VLKLFSIGNILLGPMVGIITEAIIAELILDAFPKPSLTAFISACAGSALWVIVQPFVTGILFFGRNLLIVWLDMLDSGSRLFGVPSQAAFGIVLALVALHLVIGGIGGWLAWKLGLVLKIRLSGNIPESVG